MPAETSTASAGAAGTPCGTISIWLSKRAFSWSCESFDKPLLVLETTRDRNVSQALNAVLPSRVRGASETRFYAPQSRILVQIRQNDELVAFSRGSSRGGFQYSATDREC